MDAVLAWTVREGVTNVIRHSHAHHCTIRVICAGESVRAEVVDDGARRAWQQATTDAVGSGLAGLSERVRAYGGQVEARPLQVAEAGGFRLWVELPMLERMSSGKEPHG
jgi:two-component system sensor histidine kinase DesK